MVSLETWLKFSSCVLIICLGAKSCYTPPDAQISIPALPLISFVSLDKVFNFCASVSTLVVLGIPIVFHGEDAVKISL